MSIHHGLRAAAGASSGGGSSVTDIRTEIADIASVLATNRATYTGRIANVYYYRQDGAGPPHYFINDGGDDIFDNANFTSPWLGSNPSTGNSSANHPNAIAYNTTSATVDGNTTWAATGYYYRSSGYGTATDVGMPNTVAGSTGNSGATYSGWMKGGNSGADGSGTRTWRTIYSGSTINGFTVYAGDATTYGTSDPGHCDLYIALGHANWSSSFGGTSPAISSAGSGGTGFVQSVFGINSSSQNNIVHIAMLLAKRDASSSPFGKQPTLTELQNIVSDVTSHLKTHFGY